MKEHIVTFMQKIFESGHAESAPALGGEQECWYLPIFGVYHQCKPGQIRTVVDSSTKNDGISLNNVLLSGPYPNNTLLWVFTRFRKESVAVAVDIEHKFYCFKVCVENRDLRLLNQKCSAHQKWQLYFSSLREKSIHDWLIRAQSLILTFTHALDEKHRYIFLL